MSIMGFGTVNHGAGLGVNRQGEVIAGHRTAPGQWSFTNQSNGNQLEASRTGGNGRGLSTWDLSRTTPDGQTTSGSVNVAARPNGNGGSDVVVFSDRARQELRPPTNQYTDENGNQITETRDGYTVSQNTDGTTGVSTPGGYQISSDMQNGTLTMANPATGESSVVWGDPHVSESDGGFWDYDSATSTFVLDDGTKITTNATSANGMLTDVDVYSGDGRTHVSDSAQEGSSVRFNAGRADRRQDDGHVYTQDGSVANWA